MILELSSHLEILNFIIDGFKMRFILKDPERAERFKKGFMDFMFAFENQDYVNLTLNKIILFLAIYADSFNTNRKIFFK